MRTHARCRVRISASRSLVFGLLLATANSAVSGSITDFGDVTTAGGTLRIGDTADGLRVVDGASDGTYSGTAIGNQQDVSGELRLQNSAEFITSGDLVIGDEGNATLKVEGGSRLMSNETQMRSRSGTGPTYSAVLISGTGSEWQNSGSMEIGNGFNFSNIDIHVGDGASLETNGVTFLGSTFPAGATSFEVRIDGPGTSWLNRGLLRASGYFNYSLSGGARAEDDGVSAWVGYSPSTVNVDGPGSEWRTGPFVIGVSSTYGGGMQIGNGGTIISDSATLITRTWQSIRIDGPESAWQIAGSMTSAGDGGTTIDVANGGLLRTGSTRIGHASSSDMVRVEGPGSRWVNDGAVDIGSGDTFGRGGYASILAGGFFESGETSVSCGPSFGGNRAACELLVDGNGSAFQGTGSVFIGGDALGPTAAGSLVVQNGGNATAAGSVVAWANGRIRLAAGTLASPTVLVEGGELEGDGSIDGDLENRGRVAPTAGENPIRISEDYFQAAGATLAIELRPDGYESLLEILGHSVLAGTLSVTLATGFSPQPGDEFTVMRFASYDGLFDAYSGLDLGGGLALAPELTSTSLVLRVIPEPSTALLTAIGLGLLARRSRNQATRLASIAAH